MTRGFLQQSLASFSPVPEVKNAQPKLRVASHKQEMVVVTLLGLKSAPYWTTPKKKLRLRVDEDEVGAASHNNYTSVIASFAFAQKCLVKNTST